MANLKQIPSIRGIDPELAKILEPMRQRIEALSGPIEDKDIRGLVIQIVRGSGVLDDAPGTDLEPVFQALAELRKQAQEQIQSLSDPIQVNANMAFEALGQAQSNLQSISGISDDLADQAAQLAEQATDLLDLATDVSALQTSVGGLESDVLATSTLLDATVSRVDMTEDSVDVITAAITSLQAELIDTTAFDPGIVWQFEGSLDGWTSNFTLTTNDYFVSVPDDAGCYARSPSGIAIDGRLYARIIARIRRTSGTGWLGRASYATSGGSAHGIDTTNFQLTLATEPIFAGGGWVIVVWDMEMLSAGGTDWVDNIIDQIQLELSDDASTEFDIDWVAIGRVAPSFFSGSLAALTSRVTATEDAIDVLSSDVVALQARATDLEGDVSAAGTAIATLSTRVTATEDAIDVNSSDIVSLSSRVTDNEADIDATSTALSGLTTRVTATEDAIDAQATDITDLQSRVTSAEGGIELNADAIESLDTRVTSAEGVNTSQATALTNLSSIVNNPTTGVAATASALGTLTTRVTSAEGSITTQAGQITSIQSALNDSTTGLTALASSLSSTQTQVNNINSSLSITAQQVTLLSARTVAGDSLINSLTSPGVNVDWDVPAFFPIPPDRVFNTSVGGRQRASAAIFGSASVQGRAISRMIDLEPGAIYEVRFSILKNLANGNMSVSLTASSDGINPDNVGVGVVVNRQIISSGVFGVRSFAGNSDPNLSGPHALFDAGKWFDCVCYIGSPDANVLRFPNGTVNGFDLTFQQVPGLVSPPQSGQAVIAGAGSRFFQISLTNRGNTVATDVYFNNVIVRKIFGRSAEIEQEIQDRVAAISIEQTARVAGDMAVAQSVTTVSTQVGLNSASISSLTSSVNGLNAQFVLRIDVNGRISGIKLAGSNTFSSFSVVADQFSIAFPGGGGTPVVPFTVGTINGVATVGITGNLIVDGTIFTRNLQDGSVSTPKMAPQSVNNILLFETGGFSLPAGQSQLAGALFNKERSDSVLKVEWFASVSHNVQNDPANKISILLAVNGGVQDGAYGLNSRNFLGEVYPGYVRFRVFTALPAGQYTFQVLANASVAEFSNLKSGFVITEVKR